MARAIVAFVLILGLTEAAVRVAAPNLPSVQRWSSQEEQAKVDEMHTLARTGKVGGVVFIGSSMMDAGLDAAAYERAFGGKVPVYNASLRSSLPILRPRVVVLGFSSSDLTPNDTVRNGQARQFFDSPGARQALGTESLMQRADRIAGSISDLVQYRNVLRAPSSWGKQPKVIDGTEIISPLGSDLSLRDRAYSDPQWVQDALRSVVLGHFTVGAPALAAIRQLLAEASSRGILMLTVNMPVTADFVSFHPRGAMDYQAATRAVEEVVRGAGAPFVDIGVWPSDLFGDPIHLNAIGSERFTALLIDPAHHH
jgi:hypothetical protein